MYSREDAIKIYCALLSRDPLAQQRFTEIGERFAQIAHLAHAAAEQFYSVKQLWAADPERAAEAAAKRWDIRAISLDELKTPKNKVGLESDTALPKSQGDLLGEMRE